MENSPSQDLVKIFIELSREEQNLALKTLLLKCKRKQLQIVYNELQPLLAVDFVTFIPRELIERIFSFLTPKELGRTATCSKQWREHANNSKLWKLLCKRKHWLQFGDETTSGELYSSPPKTHNPQSPLTSPSFHLVPHTCHELPPVCRWKDVYVRAHHLYKNWITGRYTVLPPFRGHKQRITCLHSSGKFVATGSDDRFAILWDLSTFRHFSSFQHPDSVLSLKLKTNLLVTGCGDGIIRIFNISTGKCFGQLTGHGSGVHDICFDGNRIISASQDRSIRVWNATSGRSLYKLDGHTDDIVGISCHGNMMISTSWDETARLWDLDRGISLHSLIGHTEVVHSCHFDSTRVATGGGDKLVKLWLIETGECTHTLAGHADDVYCVSFNNDVIVSGSADSTIRIWSWYGGSLHTLKEHIGVVRCLYLYHDILITAGDQKKIVVWNPVEGKLLNVVHRNPSLVNIMEVTSTRLIVATPESPGTMTILSYW